MRTFSLGLISALALSMSACDFEVGDLNNPSIDELEDSPTVVSVNVACTSLIAGHRVGVATANGLLVQLGMLGREVYNFDAADPRFFNELLVGTLSKGSPFGGAFWTAPYSNIRLANLTIAAVDKVIPYTAEQRAAIKGWARTFIALDLLRVIVTRDSIGAVVDTDQDPQGPLGAIAPKAAVYAAIAKYLDDAKADLVAAGSTTLPFPVTEGFEAFRTAPAFLKFNRAMRARSALYAGDAAAALAALGESFINDAATTQAALDVGPYFVFSAGAGDTENLLTNRNIFAHPSIATDAQLNGTTPDARLTRKTRVVAPGGSGGGGLSSNLKFTAYTKAISTVPIIRNEELLLLRAEARAKMGMKDQAIADLNIVRTVSGSLPPLLTTITDAEVTNEILYNRRYSLLFEGGHRWIDTRRFGRINDLPLDKTDHRRNVRYPIPQAECDARPGETACTLGSVE